MRPLVSIISINYNSLKVTCELLDSLREIDYQHIEIVLIDNASTEDPTQLISTKYPEVKFIRSTENLGFSGGNNLGIANATGAYFLFLNNDTEVAKNFLEPLVDLLEKNKQIGMVSPKILYFNSGNRIQYVGSSKINPYTGRNEQLGFMEIDAGQYDSVRETALAHGAAMMVPRSVVVDVGTMPEIFFLYYEEIDWSESIKRKGYSIYVCPTSIVYHKESQSTGKNSPLKTYYMTRNRLLFLRRNTFGIEKMLWVLFFIFFSFPKNSLMFLVHGEFDLFKEFLKGIRWNVTQPLKE